MTPSQETLVGYMRAALMDLSMALTLKDGPRVRQHASMITRALRELQGLRPIGGMNEAQREHRAIRNMHFREGFKRL